LRILLADTFYYYRGGSSVYVIKLAELLRSAGHEVFHFAMRHPNSLPCPETEEYWPDYIEYPELLKRKTPRNIFRVLKRTIHSKEAEEGIRRLLEDKGPFDIAHLNNIHHHLTPSILYPLKSAKIPVAWTLHDYSLICPNTNFVDNRTGKLCSKCLGGGLKFVQAPISRCKKSSFSASFIAALESSIHRAKSIAEMADIFISPSEFLIEKFVEAGYDRSRFEKLSYFIDSTMEENRKTLGYALYAGRLSMEKGVDVLIRAWQDMSSTRRLLIAGTGPEEFALREAAKGFTNIEFLGFVEPEKLSEIRRGAEFTIIPSICWDNFPISVMESLADGVPVLGSNIGGIPEMVEDGVNGLLFEPGNSEELARKAQKFFENPEFLENLGIQAREIAREKFSSKNHLEKLISIYKKAKNSA